MKRWWWVLLIVLAIGCTPNKLTPDQLVRWVDDPENGLIVSKEIGAFRLRAQYRPLDYEAIRSLGQEAATFSQIKKESEDLSDLQYFVLRIESLDKVTDPLKTGASTPQEVSRRLQYFSTFLQNNISLVDGVDTIPCCMFHFERNYKVAPYSNFIIGFRQNKEELAAARLGTEVNYHDKALIVEDELLGIGRVVLRIKKESITDIPQLEVL